MMPAASLTSVLEEMPRWARIRMGVSTARGAASE